MQRQQAVPTLVTTLLLAAGLLVTGGCQDGMPTSASDPSASDGATTARHEQPHSQPARAGQPSAAVYRAELTPLNDSDVRGMARFKVNAGQFTAMVNARGLAPRQVHAQHIHGFTASGSAASTCPTAADDADGNGILSVGEGAPSYGGILVPLDGSLGTAEGLGEAATFPTADNDGGAVTYRQRIATIDLGVNGDRSFEDLALGTHAVVLHGDFVSGEGYRITLPVACGTIDRVN